METKKRNGWKLKVVETREYSLHGQSYSFIVDIEEKKSILHIGGEEPKNNTKKALAEFQADRGEKLIILEGFSLPKRRLSNGKFVQGVITVNLFPELKSQYGEAATALKQLVSAVKERLGSQGVLLMMTDEYSKKLLGPFRSLRLRQVRRQISREGPETFFTNKGKLGGRVRKSGRR